MNYYPQYIHIPTTVPVQRYFADPHVQMNQYDIGGIINAGKDFFNNLGEKANGFFGESGTLGNVFGGNKLSAGAGGLVTGIGGAVGKGLYSLGTGKFDRGTGAGKAISGIGNAAGDLIGKVNPLLGGIVKAGSGLIGGLANRISGYHLNDATIGAINSDINALNSTRIADSSNESIANQAAAQNWGGAFGLRDIGSWGWASKGKVQSQFDKLQRGMQSGQNYMAANYDNAATNVSKNTMSNLLINSSAFGGELDPFAHSGSMATLYSMGQQRLANQFQMPNQQQPMQPMQPMQSLQTTQYGFGGRMPFCFGGNKFGCGGRFFSGGGNMNTHGADFTNGLVYIENGGTHEENPYQGVPMGYDQQGVPNVVEEGEIVIPKRLLGSDSDYVLSNRIPITEEFAAKYHLSPDLSIAKAAEKLTKESRENPNDVIIERTNTKLMRELRDMQEQIKQEMQQQQEQRKMTEQRYAQAMGVPQQAMSVPQEQEALNMQAMQEAAQQQAPETQQPMMAFGGNIFGRGGYFGPVNKFSGDEPFNPSEIKFNRYNVGYSPEDVYQGMGIPSAWLLVIEHMKERGMTDQQVADAFNKWQDKYDYVNAHPNDEKAIRDLQEYVKSNFGGVNGVFNANNLTNKYFDPAYRSTGTDKSFARGSSAWVDGIHDGFDYLRHGGMRGMTDADAEAIRSRLAESYPSLNYHLPEDKQTYRMSISQQEPVKQQHEDGNAPNQDDQSANNEYLWDENGKYIGEELKPHEYFTEDELKDFENEIDRRNGVTERGQQDLLPTWQRMVPLWASGIGVLTDALGLTNKPDYSDAASIEALASKQRGYMPVSYKPIGQKMTYTPFDPYQAMIAHNAGDAALRRALQDNGNGKGAAVNAALVAANRNSALASGQLALQGQMYNAQNYERALGFNRETDAQNSQGIMSADAQNAYNWRLGQGAYAQLFGQALAMRQAERHAADAARAANLSNFVKGMGNYGKENAYINMTNTNAANQGYHYGDRRFGVAYGNPYFQYPDYV